MNARSRVASRVVPRAAPLAGRIAALLLAVLIAVPAARAEEPDGVARVLRPDRNRLGRVFMQLRARHEFADDSGLAPSNAATLRASLGWGTRTWRGFSALAEAAGTLAASRDAYFDGVRSPNGKTLVPDPAQFGVRRAVLTYEKPGSFQLRVGRQQLVFDDSRFVGNQDWRQNPQTFDAARISVPLGLGKFLATYAYVDRVIRPFGDRGPASLEDFASASHLANLTYRGDDAWRVSLFGYHLDFENSPRNSTRTYGARFVGKWELGPELTASFSASLARQTDLASNPLSYRALYAAAEGTLALRSSGALTLGAERLGSDAGRAQFVTPIASSHAFGGTADAFTDNGGPRGLRDLYVRFAPDSLGAWRTQATYHHFESDHEAERLGWEADFELTRPLGRFLSMTLKGAYFRGENPSLPDRVRTWIQLTASF